MIGRFALGMVFSVLTYTLCVAQQYSVTIDNPRDGDCVNFSASLSVRFSGPLPMHVTARDDWGNTFFDTWFFSAPPNPYVLTWDRVPLGVPDGPHVLTVRAEGLSGAWAEDSVWVRADGTPPIPTISSPVHNSFVSGVVNIEGSLADNYSGAGAWSMYIDGKKIATGAGSDVSVPWVTEGLVGGSVHTITLRGSDNCGNMGVSNPVSIRIGAMIKGQVTLGGFFGHKELISFRVQIRQNGKIVDELPTMLDSEGRYSVITQKVGPSQDVILKPSHWLSVKFPEQDITGTLVLNTDFPWNGDPDNSNWINVFDINTILLEYSLPTVSADMDGRGIVDIYDLNTVLLNFTMIGEE